jgi:hypothetical protein
MEEEVVNAMIKAGFDMLENPNVVKNQETK